MNLFLFKFYLFTLDFLLFNTFFVLDLTKQITRILTIARNSIEIAPIIINY